PYIWVHFLPEEASAWPTMVYVNNKGGVEAPAGVLNLKVVPANRTRVECAKPFVDSDTNTDPIAAESAWVRPLSQQNVPRPPSAPAGIFTCTWKVVATFEGKQADGSALPGQLSASRTITKTWTK